MNRRILVSLIASPVLWCTAPAAAQEGMPGEGWTQFLQRPGSRHEVDSLAFMRLDSGVYRFAHRFVLDQPLADSAGERFDRVESISEYDCARGRYRDRGVRLIMGERLLRHTSLDGGWTEPEPAFRKVFDLTCAFVVALGERLPPQREIYRMKFLDELPELANRNEVARAIAREHRGGEGGEAVVGFKVLADGSVERASIFLESATAPEVGRMAMRVIARMRFTPGKLAGRAVATWVALPITAR